MVGLCLTSDRTSIDHAHTDHDESAHLMIEDDNGEEVQLENVPISFLFRLLRDARAPRRTAGKMPSFTTPHKEPQEAGVRLLMGGEFGRVRAKVDIRSQRQNIARQLLSRRSRLRPLPKQDISQVGGPTMFLPTMT